MIHPNDLQITCGDGGGPFDNREPGSRACNHTFTLGKSSDTLGTVGTGISSVLAEYPIQANFAGSADPHREAGTS